MSSSRKSAISNEGMATLAVGKSGNRSEETLRHDLSRRGGSIQARRVIVLLSLIVFPSAVAFAETGKPPDPQAARRGAPLYQEFCQSCHGERGVGEQLSFSAYVHRQIIAPALDDSQHAWHHSDDDLTAFILNGSPRTPRMPAWKGTLTESQVRDIVAYIKSLWGPRAIACQGPKHMSCM